MTGSRRARSLRRAAPVTEQRLWTVLRSRRLGGLKFRRQVPIGLYVVDFLCARHRLVVEADGPLHDPDRDAIRDAWLRAQGFRVLRFANSEVDAIDGVLGRILEAVEAPPAGWEV